MIGLLTALSSSNALLAGLDPTPRASVPLHRGSIGDSGFSSPASPVSRPGAIQVTLIVLEQPQLARLILAYCTQARARIAPARVPN